MTLLCVPIIGPSWDLCQDQIQRAKEKADLFELRVDLFTFPLSMVHAEGNFILAIRKSVRFEELLHLKPEFVDVEHDDVRFEEIKKAFPESEIISSYHNYDGPDYVIADKVCTTAKSTVDALKMLLLIKKQGVIGISMGEWGSITRILAPIFQSKIVYASLEEGLESAPGQIPVNTLLEQYHFKSLSPKTKIYGLIGSPVIQSPSHITHNQVIRELGVDAVYVKMVVNEEEIPEFLTLSQELGISGLSVTMPLKEKVILKEVVNTLLFGKEGIRGINTDGRGALDAIEKRMLVAGKRILIVGAGGSAKAIAHEAKRRGAFIFITNRTMSRAEELAKFVKGQAVPFEEGVDHDILIQCTPCKTGLGRFIKEWTLVMDITVAKETEFLKAARNLGCQTIPGLEMLRNQAALQFKAWLPQEEGVDEALDNAFKTIG